MTDAVVVGKPARIEHRQTWEYPVTPASATVSLYDNTGALVAGSPFTCVLSTTASTTDLNISWNWASPVLGQFRLQYALTYADATVDTLNAQLWVIATPPATKVATYDPTTTIGKTRFWAQDTDMNEPMFSDAEVQVALDATLNGLPQTAAVLLLENKAAQYTAEAMVVKTAEGQVDMAKRAKAMQDLVLYLRTNVVTDDPSIVSPLTQQFIPDYVNATPATNMDPW